MNTGRQLLSVALLAGGLWWLLTGGAATAWIIGVPAVAIATLAAWRLRRSSLRGIPARGLSSFLPFFLLESLRGGSDVALRTLAPRMRIQPGFITYSTRLPDDRARVFFANCVCLLPGTLAADLNHTSLYIHVLDISVDNASELERLEQAVAKLFPAPANQEAQRT